MRAWVTATALAMLAGGCGRMGAHRAGPVSAPEPGTELETEPGTEIEPASDNATARPDPDPDNATETRNATARPDPRNATARVDGRAAIPGAHRVHVFDISPLSSDPGEDELAFDAVGFQPPRKGQRYVVADYSGVLGIARIRRVFVVERDQERCDATTRYFVARFERSPSRETDGRGLVALGPLQQVPSADDVRVHTDVAPSDDLPRTARDIRLGISLAGDHVLDLVTASMADACEDDPPARTLRTPPGPPTFQRVGETCAERWARTPSGWKPVQRIDFDRCSHETPDRMW